MEWNNLKKVKPPIDQLCIWVSIYDLRNIWSARYVAGLYGLVPESTFWIAIPETKNLTL